MIFMKATFIFQQAERMSLNCMLKQIGPTSYGDGNGDVIVANYAGGNFKAPSDGYYLFSVNLKTMKYLLMKTTWGMIGGATPGGWDKDTPLNYNPSTQSWSVTADMKASGSFKFRANNAWQLDFDSVPTER
jgi:hypothetical protein